MWLLIDNYDSFAHILHHYLLRLEKDVRVYRNDSITIEEIRLLNPERIIISPGPLTPDLAGITLAVIEQFHKTIPILGICLGHQALGQYFGAKVVKAIRPVHGKTSVIRHDNSPMFTGIPVEYKVMRYHSLVIEKWQNSIIMPLAFAENGELMALQIKGLPCWGLQFHPESILTEYGFQLLVNWDKICKEKIW